MKQLNCSSQLGRGQGRWQIALAASTVLAASLILTLGENTNQMIKPPVALPGGLSLHPVVTSVTRTQDLVTVQWFGIQGPFQLLHSPAAQSNVWQTLGQPTFASQTTVQLADEAGFFRVLSGRPVSTAATGGTLNYVGAALCAECHEDAHASWSETPHARALDTLKAIKQDKNTACLVCHTVGFDTPLGFKSEGTTPHLAGVQCENCHGPGGAHVANVRDPSARPKVTVASEVCGGCHNFHHPTFDEWKQSAHATPVPDVAAAILAQGEPRMLSCGPCHSGAVRESLLEGIEHPGTPLPSRQDAAYFGVTCAVCHDAHENMPFPPKLPNPQLRNPLYSLRNFSYSTATNTSFAAQYNRNIQLCAQCHNMRGARWQDTARPPHESPQYNILIGQGAYDLGKPIIAAHGADLETQCVFCHGGPNPATSTTTAMTNQSTNYTHHTFAVRFENCVECHITLQAAERATTRTQQQTKDLIESVRALLDNWATTKAPTDLQAKYGALAWEYSTPGSLSNPTNNPAVKGPTAAEQIKVPDAIKQARMNLYLVENDGSFGVHNGTYARYLLSVAKTNIAAASAP